MFQLQKSLMTLFVFFHILCQASQECTKQRLNMPSAEEYNKCREKANQRIINSLKKYVKNLAKPKKNLPLKNIAPQCMPQKIKSPILTEQPTIITQDAEITNKKAYSFTDIQRFMNQGNFKLADTVATQLLQQEYNACEIVTYINDLSNHLIKNQRYDDLNTLYHSRTHITLLTSRYSTEPSPLNSALANLCYTFGQYSKNDYYLNAAIKRGHTDALFVKASKLLGKQNKTAEQEKEILNLLKICASSTNTHNADAANLLATLYYDYTIQPSFFRYTSANNKKALKYLKLALSFENNTFIGLLGLLYHYGVKAGDTYIIEPTPHIALTYLHQHTPNKSRLSKEILYTRGILLYKQNRLQEAYSDFENIPLNGLPENVQSRILFYKMSCLLKTSQDETQHERALGFCLAALELSDCDSSMIDKMTELIIAQKTRLILLEKKDTDNDIFWCSAAGRMYIKSLYFSMPGITEKTYGLECLQYAADCGDIAALRSAGTAFEDIPLADRLDYLFQAYDFADQENDNAQALATAKLLIQIAPKNLLDIHNLLDNYYQNNDLKATLRYVESLFYPFGVNFNFSLSQEAHDNIIQQFDKNSFLQNLIQLFIKSPQLSTRVSQKATIFAALTYGQSCKKEFIMKAISYLELLQETTCVADPKMFNELCGKLIPNYYNRLAQCWESESVTIAFKYFEKSASLNFLPSIQYIGGQYLLENKLVSSQLIAKIYYQLCEHIKLNTTDTKSLYLVQQIAQKKSSCAQSAPAKQPKQHASTDLLIHGTSSSFSEQSEYQKALSLFKTKKEQSLEILTQLTRQQEAHPHACLAISLHYWKTNNPRKNRLCEILIKNTFEQAIVCKNNSAKFIDYYLLRTICRYLYDVLTPCKNKKMPAHINNMMKLMTEKGINMTHFKKYLLDTDKINLDNYK